MEKCVKCGTNVGRAFDSFFFFSLSLHIFPRFDLWWPCRGEACNDVKKYTLKSSKKREWASKVLEWSIDLIFMIIVCCSHVKLWNNEWIADADALFFLVPTAKLSKMQSLWLSHGIVDVIVRRCDRVEMGSNFNEILAVISTQFLPHGTYVELYLQSHRLHISFLGSLQIKTVC